MQVPRRFVPRNDSTAALVWEFRARHRWGLIALGVYLAVLATIKLFVVTSGVAIHLDTPVAFALVVVVPMSMTFTYFIAMFTFGYAGDLGARQSIFPARLFTLPVPTRTLAGLPMLLGCTAMALLWLATRAFALWPSDLRGLVPVFWPALLAASLLAWTQALMWMPYGLPGMRVVAAMVCLTGIDSIVILALHYHARELTMLAILAPQVPLAWLVAQFAVASARRGDVPDWSGAFSWLGGLARARSDAGQRFPSPARAQLWFEWRQHGRSLPVLVAILVPLELWLLWLAVDAPALVYTILVAVLLTPPFMAAFTAATVSKSNAQSDSHGLSPFTAARPISGAALISAKMKATVLSTLLAWAIVLVAIPIALRWSGTWSVVVDRAQRTVGVFGLTRAIVLYVCLVLVFMASTWKQLVQSLFIGLTGRDSLIKGSVFATLALISVLGPVLQWIADHRDVERALWDAFFTWLPGLFVLCKMALGSWVIVRLHRARLLSDRAMITWAAAWLATVLLIYGMLVWFAGTRLIPHYLLAFIAILSVPLVRVSAAPLALAWNRHR